MKKDYSIFSKEDFIAVIQNYEESLFPRRNIYQDLLNYRIDQVFQRIKEHLQEEADLIGRMEQESEMEQKRKQYEDWKKMHERYEELEAERGWLMKLREVCQ